MAKAPSRLTHECGKPSGTKTLFVIVVLSILIRGLLSGVEFGGVSIAEIPDTLQALAALSIGPAAVFGWRLKVKHDEAAG